MKLTKAIDRNCKCLKNYFHKKFELMEVALEEEKNAPIILEDASSDESQSGYHGFSQFIIPDMVINTYSLLEWWLRKICDFQRRQKNLDETYEIVKKPKNDFDKYHKYLINYVCIDLSSVEENRLKIDSLRKVRNRLIHHGGDISSNEQHQYSEINGISVISLSPKICYLVIEDYFVWDMIDHVQKYLYKAVTS